MSVTHTYRIAILLTGLWATVVLLGCGGGGGSDTEAQRRYSIRLTNLTANQPMSPAALVFHPDDVTLWETGDSADAALEVLAESGDPQPFLTGAAANAAVVETLTGTGVIVPGGSEDFTATVPRASNLSLTLATMLVNTNDAFAGTGGRVLPELAVGEGRTWYLPAYDAGTEGNTETAATVPGPAAGGEGFNATRDDGDRIFIHPGVISSQDGLVNAALDASHRWDNPVLRVKVVRLE